MGTKQADSNIEALIYIFTCYAPLSVYVLLTTLPRSSAYDLWVELS